ncbi:hypothetical protein [Hymenobacter fodinae]|uniref:Uncharacterized protein n=1 Tax=Hymenobacter fodinae TaxID=2510796 RepID=A0A4Z0NZ76_9BACT|nr:hypothetical protein [Hymenobacter fodinae]TGE04120.1 hypothetical protein EU556_22890 [Hymenobacter fodinae]
MTYSAIRLFCLMALGCIALPGHAQETASYSRPQVQISEPVYVLNSSIIINGLLQNINPQHIKSIEVYKDPGNSEAQAGASHLKNLSRFGVINITYPKRVRSRTFAQVGRRLGLRGPLIFALNGHTLSTEDAAALRIAPVAIGQLHIQKPTPEAPETRVDIWLTLPPNSSHSPRSPGTILLR